MVVTCSNSSSAGSSRRDIVDYKERSAGSAHPLGQAQRRSKKRKSLGAGNVTREQLTSANFLIHSMLATPSKAFDAYKPFPSLKGQKAIFTSSSPFTPSYVQSHTSSKTSAYTTRVEGRQLLLENPARESRRKKLSDARKARQKQDGMRRKAGILSRREAKLTGAWKLGKRDLTCVSSSFPP